MHAAPIKRIGVDRACRIAATGSYDKTVRVWSLPDGRLLHTLRGGDPSRRQREDLCGGDFA